MGVFYEFLERLWRMILNPIVWSGRCGVISICCVAVLTECFVVNQTERLLFTIGSAVKRLRHPMILRQAIHPWNTFLTRTTGCSTYN
jgi:hypothetical protein